MFFVQALGDLLRNYNYKRWQFKLKHILVALLNLGANPDMIGNIELYKASFKDRINMVKEMYKYQGKQYRFVHFDSCNQYLTPPPLYKT
jgi:hypothetical protein